MQHIYGQMSLELEEAYYLLLLLINIGRDRLHGFITLINLRYVWVDVSIAVPF